MAIAMLSNGYIAQHQSNSPITFQYGKLTLATLESIVYISFQHGN